MNTNVFRFFKKKDCSKHMLELCLIIFYDCVIVLSLSDINFHHDYLVVYSCESSASLLIIDILISTYFYWISWNIYYYFSYHTFSYCICVIYIIVCFRLKNVCYFYLNECYAFNYLSFMWYCITYFRFMLYWLYLWFLWQKEVLNSLKCVQRLWLSF